MQEETNSILFHEIKKKRDFLNGQSIPIDKFLQSSTLLYQLSYGEISENWIFLCVGFRTITEWSCLILLILEMKDGLTMKKIRKLSFQESHRSSVGRAGDCKSSSIDIPRSMVRIRPVRDSLFSRNETKWFFLIVYWHENIFFKTGKRYGVPS